jgi:hypothetical protein
MTQEMKNGEMAYGNYTIYTQANEFFPIRVTFRRPDGFSAEPRQFKSLAQAKAWCDEMDATEAPA